MDLIPESCSYTTMPPDPIVTDYDEFTCYTWMCPSAPDEPPDPRAHAICRLNKTTGELLCPTRASGGSLACPASFQNGSIVVSGRRTANPDGLCPPL